MKIKTYSEMKLRIKADDLVALLYRAKQGEILYHDKLACDAKLMRLKQEHTKLHAAYAKLKEAHARALAAAAAPSPIIPHDEPAPEGEVGS